MHAGRHLAYGDASTGHFNYSTLPNFYAGAIAPDVTQTAEYSQQNDTLSPPFSPPFSNPGSSAAQSPKERKKRGRPSTKPKSTLEWNDEEVKDLCAFWSREEILYNSKHPKHFVKEERDKAVKRIVEGLQSGNIEVTEQQVTAKMTSLRSYFCAQKSKEKTSRTSGAGTSQVYESQWKFIKDLEFLSDSVTPRKSTSNLNRNEMFDDSDDSMSVASSVSTKSSKKAGDAALQGIEATNEVLNACLNRLSKSPKTQSQNVEEKSADHSFCNLLANILTEIPEGEDKDTLKLNMHKAVLDVKYGRKQNTFNDF